MNRNGVARVLQVAGKRVSRHGGNRTYKPIVNDSRTAKIRNSRWSWRRAIKFVLSTMIVAVV
jgi:hypothetical protein